MIGWMRTNGKTVAGAIMAGLVVASGYYPDTHALQVAIAILGTVVLHITPNGQENGKGNNGNA